MPDMNKVEVSFTADVTSFNRGVDRMERKIDEFDAKTEKELNNVNRRFDLLDGSVKKVEKSMNGFGDNVEMRGVQKQLIEVKDEFERTGKVGQGAINGLNSAIVDVDFDSLDSKSKKAFKTVQKDATKLTDQVNKLKHIQFANNFEQENKVIAYSFSKLNESLNSTSLALNKVRKGMSPQQAQQYSKSMVNVRKTMSDVRSELNTTGTVSRDTFYRLKKDIETVNFNKLPMSARKAISEVSVSFSKLNRDIDISGTHIDRNHDKMRRFSSGVRNTLNTTKQDFSKFVVNINRIGTAFRNVGEVSAGAIRGGILASLTSVIPIAGTATTAIMGIGAGLGTVAGGAIGLGGAFGIAGLGAKMFIGQTVTALKMLEDGTLKVTNEVENYQATLKGLKSDWEALINKNQAALFNTMTNGIASARYALSTLNPFLADTAQKIAVASQKMHQWITTSDNAKNAFAMLNKIGPTIFQNILNSAGHVGNGVTRIFTAFGPLFTWTGQQLENLSKKFDIWANSSNTQRGIASFINYTKENLPVLSSVFNNTFLGIINLFKAFSGQTSWALKGLNNLTERFRNWAATLDQTQGFKDFIAYTRANAPVVGQFIGNLVNIMVAFVRAAAPVGEVVLKIVTAFTGWLAKMMNSHPIIAQMLAVMFTLVGVFKMSAIAVGLLIAPFGRLISVLGLLIGKQRIEAIQQRLLNKSQIKSKGIIGALRGAYTGLITKIKALAIQERLAAIQTRIANGVKKAAIAISNSYRRTISRIANAQMIQAAKTKIAAAATAIWTGVTKGAALAARGLGLALRFMTGPIGIIITIIGVLVGVLVHLWKTNSGFRNGVIAIWNSIKQAALNIFGWLGSFFSQVWNGIKFVALTTWNWIKSAAISTWNGIKWAIQNPIQALKSILSAIWNGIKWAAISVWNGIKTAVLFIINGWITATRLYFNALKLFWSALWNGIKYVAVTIWNAIKAGVMYVINGWITAIRFAFNGLKLFFMTLWNGIKRVAITTWNLIKTGVIAIIRTWITFIRYTFNALRIFFINTWNAIKRVSLAVWNAIKNGVIAAIRILNNTVRSIISTLRTWIINAWNFIKNKVIAAARALYNGVKWAFNALRSAVIATVSRLRTWLISAWNYIKNKIVSLMRSMYNSVKNIFATLWKYTNYIFSKLKSWLVNTWRNIRNSVTSHVSKMWASMKSTFNSLWSGVKNIFGKVKSFITKTWNTIKNSVVSSVKKLWSSVSSIFWSMKNGLDKVVGKIKGIFSGLTKSIKTALNKLIEGINWVADKIGMDKLPKFSTGTATQTVNRKIRTTSDGRLKQDTMAVVGDKGKGNGPGGFRHETITYPNGKQVITPNTDTVAYLPKNSSVDSGMTTYQRLNSMPHFAGGTKKKGGVSGFFDNMREAGGKMLNAAGNKVGNGVKKAKETGSKVAKSAGKIASGAVSAIGDVMDYIDNPGKLVDKIIGAFGFNFDFAKGSLITNLLGAAYKKLKKGVSDLFAGWLEDSGGGDDSLLTRYPMVQPFGRYRGGLMFNGGRHYGVDFAYPHGADVYATNNGTVSSMHDYGGGLIARLLTGQFTLFFMHLSKILKTGKVKIGDKIAKSGNSGNFTTGPHLHFQVNRGHDNYVNNANAIEPMKWLAGHGGGGGGKKSPSKWRSTIVRAAKKMKVNPSNAQINGIIAQIQRESGGDAGITQSTAVRDINAITGNLAQGLLQYVPSTFRSYAVKGHTNIKSGYDQLLAFFNNSNWANDIQYGRSGWGPRGSRRFATGTNSAPQGLSMLFEKGGEILNLNGGEQIIPNDVSIAAIERVIKSDIFKRTQEAVFNAMAAFANAFKQPDGIGLDGTAILNALHNTSRNMAWLANGGFSQSVAAYDPMQRVNASAVYNEAGQLFGYNNSNDVLQRVETLLQDNNRYQRSIDNNTNRAANKSGALEMNGKVVAREIANDVNNEIKRHEQLKVRFKGGGR